MKKKKAPTAAFEYATWKEEYLAAGFTPESYEKHLVQIEQRLREFVAKRTRPDGTVEPWLDIVPGPVEEVVEYETSEECYLAERGTMEGFEEHIASMERRLREIAASRTRPDGTVRPLFESDPTWRKKRRKK
jgi:hypothetical protein